MKFPLNIDRRTLLRSSSAGFGYVALSAMLNENKVRGSESVTNSYESRPHFSPRANRIIFVFLQGAISQVDTFEYKPELQSSDGKSGPNGGTLVGSKFKFRQYGETGSWFSELLPNLAQHADSLCWLRGLHTDTPAHPQAVVQLHTGAKNATLTRPSMGAWLLYGLGSENKDLPGYVTINPPASLGGAVNYGSAFLPAEFQGSRISDRGYVPDLLPAIPEELQKKQLDLVQQLNRGYSPVSQNSSEVEGVIRSYELAFRMQDRIPELLDLSTEPKHIQDDYGIGPGPQASFARQCLMARRLSEAGVRFVEICQPGWDHHNNLNKGLIDRCQSIDQPVAALLKDLEQRGMLDDTLVLFGSEFGRQPTAQGPDGRDHNITGYPMFLTGAGVRKGFSWGATDEFGVHAVEGRMHTNDLHATILALMGINHEELTYPYAGRNFRLTDVAGKVATEIFS